jgi:hypothetical protein
MIKIMSLSTFKNYLQLTASHAAIALKTEATAEITAMIQRLRSLRERSATITRC